MNSSSRQCLGISKELCTSRAAYNLQGSECFNELPSIPLQASFDSVWEGNHQPKKSTIGATLGLWGIPWIASCRSQALDTSSLTQAALYAMGMATCGALHLQSFLQEMNLSQLTKPFELTVSTDSSSGKALPSQLGLTKRSKHVQLGLAFKHPLMTTGQLDLRRVAPGKNPATMLAKHLSASTLRKLLPKLGVRTRAADSRDLLSMLNLELLASFREAQSSFFIGMMAEQPASAQLVASTVALRSNLNSSFHSQSGQSALNLQSSQRAYSLDNSGRYDLVVSFKMYDLVSTAMLVTTKLYWFIGRFASTRTPLRRALGKTSSGIQTLSAALAFASSFFLFGMGSFRLFRSHPSIESQLCSI